MTAIGHISDIGSPEAEVTIISGVALIKDTALLDTGFSGFVLIPPSDAEKLGLLETEQDEMYLADGKAVDIFYAKGEVEVGQKVYRGRIAWLRDSTDTDIIIGREVLKQARVIIDYDAMEVRVPQV